MSLCTIKPRDKAIEAVHREHIPKIFREFVPRTFDTEINSETTYSGDA